MLAGYKEIIGKSQNANNDPDVKACRHRDRDCSAVSDMVPMAGWWIERLKGKKSGVA